MTQKSSNEALSAVLTDIESEDFHSRRRHVRRKADNLILFIARASPTGESPSRTNFFPVRCRDLSCGGVSFFLPARPNLERLIVQLGNDDGDVFMEAQVIHISTVSELPKEKEAWDSSGKKYEIELGMTPFQIGCQFQRRVPSPAR